MVKKTVIAVGGAQSAVAREVLRQAVLETHLQADLNRSMQAMADAKAKAAIKPLMSHQRTDKRALRAIRKQNAHGGTISTDKQLAELHTPRQQRKLMKLLRKASKEARS